MIKLFRDMLSPAKHVPRVHPNGFIQIDLDHDGDTRLHIFPNKALPHSWLPEQKTNHPIHDHKFDMRSMILRGRIEQRVWIADLTAPPSHEIFTAQGTGSQTRNSTLAGTGVTLGIYPSAALSASFGEGESYTQYARTFHETKWGNLAVTVMEKERFVDHEPRVLVPISVEPDNEYDRWSVDNDAVWEYVWSAMRT